MTRTVLTALFLGLLITVVWLNRTTGVDRPTPAADAVSRYGVAFLDVSRAAGLDSTHQPPTFDARLGHIMPIVAAMGAAVSVVDVDRDGWQDMYVTNSAIGSLNRLFRNNHDGTFSDVAGRLGIADVNRAPTGVSMGSVWGDYDNDGFEDLLLYKYGRPELFRNMAGQRFEAVTAAAGLPPWVNAHSAIWLDYDRDGWLDLFLAGYWPEQVNLWAIDTTRIMPESFEYAENGGRKYLLHNQRDGTFADATEVAGIAGRRWTLAAVAGDLSGGGGPDLFLANDYGISQLFVNRGGRFIDVSRESGIGRAPKSGMSASAGDVLGDGRQAIYQTNISEPGVLIQGNNLWVRRTDSPDSPTFENIATTLGVEMGGWSWGAQFGDLNNDGALDLFLVNGYISGPDRSSYWYDFSQIAVGHSAIIADAANWPPMRGRSLSGYQRKHVWLNDGAGQMRESALAIGVTDTDDGRAVAIADFSNRGQLDVVVASQGGPLRLYRSTVAPGRHWIGFDLSGTRSNRSGIGARVELRWAGRRQVQEVHGGSGFSAQNQRRLHFGLGTDARVDLAVITWPSGAVQRLEQPAIDRVHALTEPR